MTIADKLTQLNTIKQDIKTAINNKGGSAGNDFNAYANAITNLPSGASSGTIVYGKSDIVTIEPYDSTVKTIGDRDFQSWTHATGLVLGEGFETVNEYAFFRWSNATSLVLPASLRTVNQYSFADWSKCTSITIKNGLEMANGARVFSNNACESIVFPDSFQYAGDSMLRDCLKLKSIKFGNNIKEIQGQAILGCPLLTEFVITTSVPPPIYASALNGIPAACVIKVPSASLAAYQAAQYWSVHASKMVGI